MSDVRTTDQRPETTSTRDGRPILVRLPLVTKLRPEVAVHGTKGGR
jgi:hypothetical protein